MRELMVPFSMWSITLYQSEYVMRIKNIHFDTQLQLYIENDGNISQQYI